MKKFFVPIRKVDEEQQMVWGYASTEAVDSEGEIILLTAMKAALPAYMEFANIREMHQLSAVGVAKEADVDGTGLWIGAKVVDPLAWLKVKEGVYKGFSVGGLATSRDPANRKIITGMELIEISLVDRPANPEALIEVFKLHQGVEGVPLPNDRDIELLAREMCKAAGQDPDANAVKSTAGLDMPRWSLFKVSAERDLNAAHDRAVAKLNASIKTEEQVAVAVTAPTRKSTQIWDCGMPAHSHTTKVDSDTCIADQETKFGKTSVPVELRKTIADRINALPTGELIKVVAQMDAAAGAKPAAQEPPPPVVKKEETAEEKKKREEEEEAEKEKARKDKEKGKSKDGQESDTSHDEPGSGADYAENDKEEEDDDKVKAQLVLTDLTPFKSRAALAKHLKTNTKTLLSAIRKALDSKDPKDVMPSRSAIVAFQLLSAETIVDDTPVAAPTAKAAAALPVQPTAKAAKDDKDDKKPKGDYGSHDEAGYADPGLQDDKKPRYPLKEDGKLSEERIRAAWNYINKEKNQEPYSAAQVTEIKDKIIAAWKEAIDPDGPPAAKDDNKEKAMSETTRKSVRDFLQSIGKADAKTSVKKGLMAACSAIGLLERLDELCEMMEIEAGREQDASAVPGRFKQIVEMFAELVEEVVEEEIEEMLNDKEVPELYDGMPMVMYCARQAVKTAGRKANTKRMGERLTKAIGDHTGSPGFAKLTSVADALTKATAAQTQEWGAHGASTEQEDNDWGAHGSSAQTIHDAAVAMGAKCMSKAAAATPAKEPATDPAAAQATTQKAATAAAPAVAVVQPAVTAPADEPIAILAKAMVALAQDVNEIKARRVKPTLKTAAVEKSADTDKDPATLAAAAASTNPKDVLARAMSTPNFVKNGRGL